jgi:SAM-dependent methyltransferase
MSPRASDLDPEALKAFAKRIFGALGGAHTALMIFLGDRMGLYRVLAGHEALTSHELAEATGLHERWLREWLFQQGAAGVLEYRGEGRFALSPEGAAVLADESHPACGAGCFSLLPRALAAAEQLPEAFRSGIGLPYDALGEEGALGIERGFAPFFRALLVPLVLPRVAGTVERLARGAEAADVGCGAGVALIEMARAFPRSRFRGYDISRHALARAERNLREAGLDNASFHDPRSEPLPEDGRFALVTSFDCLHDMTDPASVMRSVRRALDAEGAWLIADVKAHASYEENIERNPMAPLMYGMSVVTCLSSSLSEPGGAGLGTLGLHEQLMRSMLAESGFSRFETIDLRHPVNAFYVARP